MSRQGQEMALFSPYSYCLRITVDSALPARATRRLLLGGGGGGGGWRYSSVHRVSGSIPRCLRTHTLSGRAR